MLLFEQERGHVVEHHPRLEERRRVDLGGRRIIKKKYPRLDDGPAACEPWTAMSLALALLGALRAALRTRTDLALENLALRQQLALLSRRSKRPRFGRLDRAFWLWLSNRWSGWRQALHLVRPETVIRWHRQGFRALWTWKAPRGRPGRPRVGSEIAELVRTMALANPLWGAPRIHGELLKLGFDISQRSVARLMPRRPTPPSQTWRTFLQNHLADLVSVDFFVVPTATFRVLYVRGSTASSPPNRALQSDRFPDRRLDRAATRRGVPR